MTSLLATCLHKGRVSHALTLKEVSRITASISPSYLSDIENGRRIPTASVIWDLCKLYNLPFRGIMSMALHEKLEAVHRKHEEELKSYGVKP